MLARSTKPPLRIGLLAQPYGLLRYRLPSRKTLPISRSSSSPAQVAEIMRLVDLQPISDAKS
jgi:hypothetical protein